MMCTVVLMMLGEVQVLNVVRSSQEVLLSCIAKQTTTRMYLNGILKLILGHFLSPSPSSSVEGRWWGAGGWDIVGERVRVMGGVSRGGSFPGIFSNSFRYVKLCYGPDHA